MDNPRRTWPALDVEAPALDAADLDSRLALALDDLRPLGIEERCGGARRVFFRHPAERDDAARAIRAGLGRDLVELVAVDVDDEAWAEKSQADLPQVVVGSLRILPAHGPIAPAPHQRSALVVHIRPSMGFGTGYHATTRLSLLALQRVPLADRSVLDVGTGSGILAVAAALLGARRVLAIDCDPDALENARDNVALNHVAGRVVLELHDVQAMPHVEADVLAANLTGAQLCRVAARLASFVPPGGQLVVSGLLAEEEEAVRHAFADQGDIVGRHEAEGWVALCVEKKGTVQVLRDA